MSNKEIIQNIRQEEYLVGVDLGKHNKGADSLRKKLDGALMEHADTVAVNQKTR